MTSIVVIDPSGPPDRDALERNIEDLRCGGLSVARLDYPGGAGERLKPAGIDSRVRLLNDALARFDVVLCARGGYGMSDLLDHLDWSALANSGPRLVVGFSDICALQSALYTRLGWGSLHAPMPGSALWRAGGEDVTLVRDVLRAWPAPCRGSLALLPAGPTGPVAGRLFGGCLSVLGALIGTEYFPGQLDGHIVFIEDVNESAPRVLRAWNQWRHSGVLEGVRAVVIGRFTHQDQKERALLQELPALIGARCQCPVFTCDRIGHVSPNVPLMIGAQGVITEGRLDWSHATGDSRRGP